MKRAFLLLLLVPLVQADHLDDGTYRCDGGWCSDGEDHILSCSRFGCEGDTRGFPTIQSPTFGDGSWLDDDDWIIAVTAGGATKVYPLRIISGQQGWELITDHVGGEPVVVTYCPLCGSPIAFSRVVEGKTLDFLNSGAIWRFDLVMYDRDTGSQWSQVAGEALDGAHHGTVLELVDQQVSTWKDWRRSHAAPVMERPVAMDGTDLCRCPVFRPGGAQLVTGVVTDAYAAAFRYADVARVGAANLATPDGSLVATITGDTLNVYWSQGAVFTTVTDSLMEDRDGNVYERSTGQGADGSVLERAQTRTTLTSRWDLFFPETLYFEASNDAPPFQEKETPGSGFLAAVVAVGFAFRCNRRR